MVGSTRLRDAWHIRPDHAAGLSAPDHAGARAALGNTQVSAGYDRQHGMDERGARRTATSGTAPYRGATVSLASSIPSNGVPMPEALPLPLPLALAGSACGRRT